MLYYPEHAQWEDMLCKFVYCMAIGCVYCMAIGHTYLLGMNQKSGKSRPWSHGPLSYMEVTQESEDWSWQKQSELQKYGNFVTHVERNRQHHNHLTILSVSQQCVIEVLVVAAPKDLDVTGEKLTDLLV